eukprot:scaffold285_cov330-Pavlova_lutheri.AAC.102
MSPTTGTKAAAFPSSPEGAASGEGTCLDRAGRVWPSADPRIVCQLPSSRHELQRCWPLSAA